METKRQRLEKMRMALRTERESFMPHWRDLSDFVMPRRARYTIAERNKGDRRNKKIIDSTATLAIRNLQAGMMSGLTSPARPWFSLATPDPELAEFGPVKSWLDDVTRRMRTIFLKSNLYNALPLLYCDEGLFGTSAMAVLEDDQDVIRCYSFPIGSYCIAQSHRQTVDTFVREWAMTVRQLVQRFGYDNCSRSVQGHYDNGNYEVWIDVAHMIHPNEDHDPTKLQAKHKRFSSCYWELGSDEEGKFLDESGFDEFPVMAPRWNLTGEDVYGYSPGMDALGDVQQLQAMQRRMIQSVDKMVNPPMVAPTSMQNKKASLLPGDITYVDTTQGSTGFKPAHELRMPLQELQVLIGETQMRIKRCFYEDLFLMLANSDRRQITAREIEERHEEKLLMLGPVLERQNEDLLDPLIDRTFAIMLRKGQIPPPPAEVAGQELKVEYISIMAQAQKLVATAGLERFVGFVGNLAAAKPDIADKLDFDQVVDEYADMLGVPPKIVRPDDDVAKIRESRAQQVMAQQRAEQLQQVAQGAKLLSETDMGGNSALSAIAAGIRGGTVPS
jgi:hypothetical protein